MPTPPPQSPADPRRDGAAGIPPVPAYKKDWFASEEMRASWAAFHQARHSLPQLGKNEAEIYSAIYADEGGGRVNKTNGAAAGITNTTLDGLRSKGKLGDLPPGTVSATIANDQMPAVMRAYFDDVLTGPGGHKAFEQLNDPIAAKALASTLFFHGGPEGGKAIQAAILKVKGPTEADIPDDQLKDGIVGTRTFDAFKRISNDPDRRGKLLDALADERAKARLESTGNLPQGEKELFDRYRSTTTNP